eukprot:GHVP01000956.1.p1 GENE.GHVP01000956.1~~GHVP01000956.1.p1  ORF type:complete len:159 (-),score=33.32 GHVP01000956.1:1038-1514(-)
MNFLFALEEDLTALGAISWDKTRVEIEDLENLIHRFGFPVPSEIKEIHQYFIEEAKNNRMDLTEQIEMLCVCINETGFQIEQEDLESGIKGFITSKLPAPSTIVPDDPHIKKKWVCTFKWWNTEFRQSSPYSRLRSAFKKGNISHSSGQLLLQFGLIL